MNLHRLLGLRELP